MKKLTYLFVFGLLALPASTYGYAGGWIGNGVNGNVSTLSESSASGNKAGPNHEGNYFLLPKGQMSLTLGIAWLPKRVTKNVTVNSVATQETDTEYEKFTAVLFSWGLNKDWTWSNYFNLRYNLYSAGRTDLALSFGPADGDIGYDSSSGFYMAPGASLLHSYYLGAGFRLIDRLGVSARYQSKRDTDHSHFSFDSANLDITLSKTFADTLTLSASGLSYAGYRREVVDNRVQKDWKWSWLVANPSLGVSTTLDQLAELGFSITFDHDSLSRKGGPTSILYLEARF